MTNDEWQMVENFFFKKIIFYLWSIGIMASLTIVLDAKATILNVLMDSEVKTI